MSNASADLAIAIAKAMRTRTEPNLIGPTEPNRPEPIQTDPDRLEPIRADPNRLRIARTQPEPAKAEVSHPVRHQTKMKRVIRDSLHARAAESCPRVRHLHTTATWQEEREHHTNSKDNNKKKR